MIKSSFSIILPLSVFFHYCLIHFNPLLHILISVFFVFTPFLFDIFFYFYSNFCLLNFNFFYFYCKVYEALYAAAQSEPLNSTAVSEGYSKYLKYVLNRPPSLPLWGSTEIETTNETERDLNPKNISRL